MEEIVSFSGEQGLIKSHRELRYLEDEFAHST